MRLVSMTREIAAPCLGTFTATGRELTLSATACVFMQVHGCPHYTPTADLPTFLAFCMAASRTRRLASSASALARSLALYTSVSLSSNVLTCNQQEPQSNSHTIVARWEGEGVVHE